MKELKKYLSSHPEVVTETEEDWTKEIKISPQKKSGKRTSLSKTSPHVSKSHDNILINSDSTSEFLEESFKEIALEDSPLTEDWKKRTRPYKEDGLLR